MVSNVCSAKQLLSAIALTVLCGCTLFPGYHFSTTSTYVIERASHTGVVVRAGGRVGGGDDLPNVSFATIEFASGKDQPDLIMLCRPGGREFWLVSTPPPETSVGYEWLLNNAEFGAFIGRDNAWLEDAAKRIGVNLTQIADIPTIQSVFSSHLNGPKGTTGPDQFRSRSLTALSQISDIEASRDWVDGMLKVCNEKRA